MHPDIPVLFAAKPVTSATVLGFFKPQYTYDVGHTKREQQEAAFQQLILFVQSLEGQHNVFVPQSILEVDVIRLIDS